MIYEYKLIVNNSIYNLGSIGDNALNLINGANTTIKKPLCSTQYKSVAGELTIKLEASRNPEAYRQVLQAILDARDNTNKFDILLEVKRGSTTVFNGYIDDTNFNITTKVLPQNLTLAARDKTVLLDEQIKYNQYLEGYNRTNLVSWLLGKLQTQTGIVIPTLLSSDLTDNGTDSTISNWVITEEDNKTYRQWIDTILYEAPGCVLWYDCANNGYRIKQLPLSVPSEDDTTIRDVHYLIASNIQTNNGVYANDGVLVSYPTVSSRADQNVYNENISRSIDEDTGKLIGTEVPVGEYMPEDGDIIATYQEFSAEGLDRAYITKESRLKNDDIALMYVKNPTYDVASDPSGAMTVETTPIADIGYEGIVSYYPRKAWILLKNTSQQIANVTLFSIKGTAIYKSKMNKMTVPLACAKPEEYETQTLFAGSEQQVQSFASWLLNAKKYSCTTSTWEESEDRVSEDNPYSQLGDIVRVPHRIDDIHTIKIPHIVVQVEDMAHTIYGRVRKQKVTAISLSGYSVYSTVRKEVIKPSAIVDDSNTIIKIVQYFGISSSTSVEPTTWTTSRADLTPTATNRYVWSYSDYTYLNGTTSSSPKTIVEVYQDVDVQMFDLEVYPSTFIRNIRDANNRNTINVALTVKGYVGTTTVEYSTNNGSTWTAITMTEGKGSFEIPYFNNFNSVVVHALFEGAEIKKYSLSPIDKTGSPFFFGAKSSDPQNAGASGLLINGDYYVTTSGQMRIYNGTTWEDLDINNATGIQMNNALKALKSEGIDLESISDSDTVSWFTNLVAENVFAEKVRGNSAFFKSITIEDATFVRGDLQLAQLRTQSGSQGDSIGATLPSPTMWNVDEVFNAIPTQDTLLTASGSYNGSSVSQVVKLLNPNAIMYNTGESLYSSGTATTSQRIVSFSGIIEHTGTLEGTVYGSHGNSGSYVQFGVASGSSVTTVLAEGETKTFSINVTKGDTWQLYIRLMAGARTDLIGTVNAVYKDVTFYSEGLTTQGLWVKTGSWQNLGLSELRASSVGLSLTINGSTYAKADHYALATNFATYDFQSLLLNRAYAVTSTGLTYRGVSKTATFFKKESSTRAKLILESGETIDLVSGEYIYMQGNIKIQGTNAGLVVQDIIPEEDNTYSFGRSDKYIKDLYAKNGNIQTVNADTVNATGTITGIIIRQGSGTDIQELHHIHYATNAPDDSQGSIGDLWIVY